MADLGKHTCDLQYADLAGNLIQDPTVGVLDFINDPVDVEPLPDLHVEVLATVDEDAAVPRTDNLSGGPDGLQRGKPILLATDLFDDAFDRRPECFLGNTRVESMPFVVEIR